MQGLIASRASDATLFQGKSARDRPMTILVGTGTKGAGNSQEWLCEAAVGRHEVSRIQIRTNSSLLAVFVPPR
jgi:hypothetical protein